jgi:hypothetical protein
MHNILRVLVNIILVCAALRHQEQQKIKHKAYREQNKREDAGRSAQTGRQERKVIVSYTRNGTTERSVRGTLSAY